MSSVGKRIKQCRLAAHLSQDVLASMVGVTKGAVSQWENDRTGNLKTSNLFNIADVLDVSPRWLATGVHSDGRHVKWDFNSEDIPGRLGEIWSQLDSAGREALLEYAENMLADN